jgi:hypothetical protein
MAFFYRGEPPGHGFRPVRAPAVFPGGQARLRRDRPQALIPLRKYSSLIRPHWVPRECPQGTCLRRRRPSPPLVYGLPPPQPRTASSLMRDRPSLEPVNGHIRCLFTPFAIKLNGVTSPLPSALPPDRQVNPPRERIRFIAAASYISIFGGNIRSPFTRRLATPPAPPATRLRLSGRLSPRPPGNPLSSPGPPPPPSSGSLSASPGLPPLASELSPQGTCCLSKAPGLSARERMPNYVL